MTERRDHGTEAAGAAVGLCEPAPPLPPAAARGPAAHHRCHCFWGRAPPSQQLETARIAPGVFI